MSFVYNNRDARTDAAMFYGDVDYSAHGISLRLNQDIDGSEVLDRLNSRASRPKREPFEPLARVITGPPNWREKRRGAGASEADILRDLVDEWIDSGYRGGIDEPCTRKLNSDSRLVFAVWDFSNSGGITVLPSPDKSGFLLRLRSHTQVKTPFDFETDDAQIDRQVALVLLSDFRHKIAKCRTNGCNSYFLLKQWRKAYKGGTLCSVHKAAQRLSMTGSAIDIDRADAAGWLRGATAKKFHKQINQNPDWIRDSRLKARIAAFLNAKIKTVMYQDSRPLLAHYPMGLTGKWVARPENWPNIELAARRYL